MDDIDQLLTDESEEKDVKEEADPTAQEPSAEKKGDEAKPELSEVEKENARLKKAIKTLQKKVEKPKEEVQETTSEDPLATREGWLAEIDRRAAEKVAPIYKASFKRATERFVKSRPEYATAEGKEKLRPILEAAKASGKVEEDEIFEVMGQTWASANWKELENAHAKISESRRRAQAVATSAAGASESSEQVADDFSESEREEAALYGKTPEAYRKAVKLLEESTIKAT